MWYYYVWVLVPIVAIIAWGARGITRTIMESRRPATDTAGLSSVNAKLDAIDARLTAVEKTLNDIP